MSKSRIAVVGFGNVGREVVPAIKESPDMEVAGIVLRNPKKIDSIKKTVSDIPVVTDIKELGKIDVAILSIPSRSIPEVAPQYLKMGINTVDSFDIHGDSIMSLRKNLDQIAKANDAVSVISSGWDPGSDSIVRGLLEVVAPKGLTYTNFGPGMSLGHTVAVKAIEGVEDALSMTIPEGTGLHRRLVYVKIKEGYDFEKISEAIKNDPYFIHDETHVYKVDDVKSLIDKGHGVHMERKGVSGTTHNQRMEFIMSICNPAAAGQVMAAAARASLRQKPGCYTTLEIPIIDFLCGEKEQLLHRLI
ncbi:Meso-diaminopimelate D-dehydrogenase [Tepidanaerobacter acetatoxydans Re1]|uniref:Meso-diaminopimelate D-dehydrogenase n=1 Tax=Tepidanaerobacter acetatoxydans (strain DSM 21804 / JCM 16047 / Re1) TaxID=1209989 RepID=F4LU20_TEPAE|nr:diaminopimelate dehydrogenase [Tepidanaerobacter acetatoxydans]AEE90546.1 diaminopimelate dehydrogenase [Tepidanaerobacter acetatoxydans Re1]CCP25059.1 Meso-diaminopimelate D-dehydrogenase [Tepidanaerobacter acetatoxydans Re1]